MRPNFSSIYFGYQRLVDAKLGSNDCLCANRNKSTNPTYSRVVKFGFWIILSALVTAKANSESMQMIFGKRSPFEIIGAVVGFIAVAVIYLRFIMRIPEKGLRDEAMDCELFLDARRNHETYSPISGANNKWAENLQTPETCSIVNKPKRPDSAERTNFVATAISNCFPAFVHDRKV